ncbi:DUF4835 family protein [Dysgonomonas sp. ZJ709]|uniref:type IX secretion system protein PorD n=1 Tax=Dysgonomonas sp. ZJ709 TaxID=2709797 RepID=UPI0013EB1545|nr:DUF4835 family protein [Dysgonomonas sp. ZJ709]
MKRYISIILFLISSVAVMQAQELNAKLTLNSQKVQSPNRELITSLENAVNQLLNEQKWTDATFSRTERIDAIVGITVNEMPTENSFIADIQITTRRPVYNSTYVTPILNYRDTQFEFSYLMGQSVDFNNYNVTSNLVATIAFYSYIIIGLDFDSFSLNGGRPYFDKALDIANKAQTLNTKGWEPFSGKGNRYDLAVALTDESSKSFHKMWYNYHRLGLDEMSSNPARARIRVIESIADLQKVYEARPSSLLLTLFAETKMEELVRICSQATTEEKQEIKKKLLLMFPTKNNIINTLK